MPPARRGRKAWGAKGFAVSWYGAYIPDMHVNTCNICEIPGRTHVTLHVITASRLRDGAILWLCADRTWSERFADAAAFDEAAIGAGMAAGEEAVRRQFVAGFYKAEVVRGPDGIAPASVRERIRASGPSVRPDLAYSTANTGA